MPSALVLPTTPDAASRQWQRPGRGDRNPEAHRTQVQDEGPSARPEGPGSPGALRLGCCLSYGFPLGLTLSLRTRWPLGALLNAISSKLGPALEALSPARWLLGVKSSRRAAEPTPKITLQPRRRSLVPQTVGGTAYSQLEQRGGRFREMSPS